MNKETMSAIGDWIKECFYQLMRFILGIMVAILFFATIVLVTYIGTNTTCIEKSASQPAVCVFTDTGDFINKQ